MAKPHPEIIREIDLFDFTFSESTVTGLFKSYWSAVIFAKIE